MKKVRTTVFFIPEQQKDFYHKTTEIRNEALIAWRKDNI